MTRRILIADAQTIAREGLHALLGKAAGLQVVGAVDSGPEALRLAAELQPDLVLLDTAMEGSDGLGVLRELKRCAPRTRALVLTAQDGEDQVWAALKAGADGYLLKEGSRAELLAAIDAVLGGRRFISPAVSGQIVTRYLQRGQPGGSAHAEFDRLTAREKQVLTLVAQGRRNRDIARDLEISVKMAEKHRANLMDKLNLHNTSALTRLAIEKGLR